MDAKTHSGYGLRAALYASAALLLGLGLFPYLLAYLAGRPFWGEISLPELRVFLTVKHVLTAASALALPWAVVALYRGRPQALSALSLVAAAWVALFVAQLMLLGSRSLDPAFGLLLAAALAIIGLTDVAALRTGVGAPPLSYRQEALKWGIATVIVCLGATLLATLSISRASAAVRLQSYAELAEPSKQRDARCRWASAPRICLPAHYALRQTGAGTLIQPSRPEDPLLSLSENVWDALGPRFGFPSGYALQSAVWNAGYFPLLYALFKQGLHAPGTAVYRLERPKIKGILVLQPRDGRWQVIASFYPEGGSSFELSSAHTDKDEALHPIRVALDAY